MSKKLSTKHPEMRSVTVVFTNGQKMNMKISSSRYDKDVLYLQSDTLTHRAWKPKGEGRGEIIGERAQKLASKFIKFNI
jgi:hypothetical protein